MREKIGIIGFGNMGSAIAERIKSNYKVFIFDKDVNRLTDLSGLNTLRSNAELVNKVDVVMLAIKPQDFESVLGEIKDCSHDKLIISIAAGITTNFMARYLPGARIIRTMPNLLGKIGEGVTFIYLGTNATSRDLDFTKELFSALGKTWVVKDDEAKMDWATAASGTAPALSCYFMETHQIDYHKVTSDNKEEMVGYLAKGSQAVGFTQQEAANLAMDIVNGMLSLLNRDKLTPAQLREKITSKGGTTAAALEVLQKGGSIEEALRAAVKRAEELSKS